MVETCQASGRREKIINVLAHLDIIITMERVKDDANTRERNTEINIITSASCFTDGSQLVQKDELIFEYRLLEFEALKTFIWVYQSFYPNALSHIWEMTP